MHVFMNYLLHAKCVFYGGYCMFTTGVYIMYLLHSSVMCIFSCVIHIHTLYMYNRYRGLDFFPGCVTPPCYSYLIWG